MRAFLEKKWFPHEEIEEAIPRLEEAHYLNDKSYAEQYLHSEVVRKGKPLLLIKQKLLMKGIEKSLLSEIIANIEAETQGGQTAKITKEFARLREKWKSDPEIVQTLVKKWFPYALVKQAMRSENE